jgi:hypothetical protein
MRLFYGIAKEAGKIGGKNELLKGTAFSNKAMEHPVNQVFR